MSGLGQHVDIGMLDCQFALMENPIIRHLATGEIPVPIGHHHPLNGSVRTQGSPPISAVNALGNCAISKLRAGAGKAGPDAVWTQSPES